MAYNYQNIRGRVNRLIWLLRAILSYFFKSKNSNDENILVSIVGETTDVVGWYSSDERLKEVRYNLHQLPDIKSYYIYFSPFQKKLKQELILGDDCFIWQYKNSYDGMKLFLKDFYNLSPKWLKIHDALLNGINDLIISKIFKTRLMFVPRGMNYYGDFLFRDKSNLVQFLKAHYNRWIYTKCIKSSDLVVGNAMFALENELISGREVYATDYLYYFGAIEALNLKPKCNVEIEYKDLIGWLKKFDFNLLFLGE